MVEACTLGDSKLVSLVWITISCVLSAVCAVCLACGHAYHHLFISEVLVA